VTRLRSPYDPQPLNPMISITVAHVACGALVFVSTIVLTLRTYRVLPARGEEPSLIRDYRIRQEIS
jgi:cytochrome bd-type quinol oxidase subunit 1